jgi:hypothetical protein
VLLLLLCPAILQLTDRKDRNGYYGGKRDQEPLLQQHKQHETEPLAAPAPASGGGRYKRQRVPNGHAAAAAAALAVVAAEAEAAAAAAAAAAACNGILSHLPADEGEEPHSLSPSSPDDDDDDDDDDDGDDEGSM